MRYISNKPFMRRLFRLWLGGVFVLFAGLIAAYMVLSPTKSGSVPATPKAQPAAAVTAKAPGQPSSPAGPAEQTQPAAVPAFDPEKDEYLLTAFSVRGMQHVTDAEPLWTLLPPGNTLVAQLIRRGPTPEPVTADVTLTYTLDPGVSLATGGPNSPPPTSGTLGLQTGNPAFASEPIPVMPYAGDGSFNPYPMATVEARDASGALLAQTRVVLPVSTEMGCNNCHGGGWKLAGKGGISRVTAEDILAVHDRKNNTRLVKQAASGKTVDCRSCHGGNPERLNLSAAVHGFHASMRLAEVVAAVTAEREGKASAGSGRPAGPPAATPPDPAGACGMCHASSEQGNTRFFRDIHYQWGLDCTRCHGALEDHALSLLRGEAALNKAVARARMRGLTPTMTAKPEDIRPRTPWVNLPQCTGCHTFTEKPSAESASAFNKWTENEDELFSHALENTGKIRCASCHGSPHAVYPAGNPMGDDRDNIQPLQYQHLAGPLGSENNCAVCHKEPQEYFIHHDRVGQ